MTDPQPALDWFPWQVPSDTTSVRIAFGGEGVGHRAAMPDGAAERRNAFLYLDCGAWLGDGHDARRDFGLVCGRTAVLCEFSGQEPLTPVTDGPAAELAALNRVLYTLAGPRRTDVTVHRALRAPAPADERHEQRPTVYLLLPDMHFPVLAKLPDLHPDLVPQPSAVACACHGPIMARIFGDATSSGAQYRAISARISRNPNDWIYMMAASYEPAATDLRRLLDRAVRCGRMLHVVQLGGLYDLWDGFQALAHAAGTMALLRPEILRCVPDDELISKWLDTTHDTPVRDAVLRLVRMPNERRTLLYADYLHDQALPPEEGREPPATTCHVGELFAENRPEPFKPCEDEPPFAVVALREQKAQFHRWKRKLAPGFRIHVVAGAAERWRRRPFAVYATAHSHRPCLERIDFSDESAASS